MQTYLSRRQLQIAAALAATLVTGLSDRRACAGDDRESKPNIIFIMADDLGYADLGCYGQKHIRTPHLDQMAEESMRFTNCYTGAPVCAPSRCVLMTGMHLGHATVRGNKGTNTPPHDGQKGRIPLKATDVTVASVLKKAGYATGITGKWGLGEPGSTGLPNDHGFDEWLGYLNQDHAPDYFTEFLWRNKDKMPLEGNRNNRQEQYSHDVMTEFAMDFIRENRGGPFFLYVPYCIPHALYQIPSVAPYENEPWEDEAKVHAAMITRMDRDVGRILTLLKELDIDGDTIVFFCSDNGSARGWSGVFDSCGPLREKKGSLYDGGIRTPMLVRWPGNTPEGSVSDVPWYFADVLPTLAELAGTTPPEGIDGVSVAQTLLGREQSLDRFLYWEKVKSGVLSQAVRWGQWKALRRSRRPLELYDVTRDIGETQNVAAENSDVTERIRKFLRNVRTETRHWPTEG